MSIKRKLRWLGGTTLGVAGGMAKGATDFIGGGATGIAALSDYFTGKNNAKKVADYTDNVSSGIEKTITNLALDEEDKQNIANGIKGGEISSIVVPLATGIAGGIKSAAKLATKQTAKSGAKGTQLIDNMISKGGKIEAASKQPLNTTKARAEATMRRNMPALERETNQAVADAKNMSLDDMFKLWKSQQNG